MQATEEDIQAEVRKSRRNRRRTNNNADTTGSSSLPPEHVEADLAPSLPAPPQLPTEALNDTCQALVDQLLEGESDTVRRAAVAKFSDLPDADKERVAQVLARQLAEEEDEWQRAWCVSALAALNLPRFAGLIAKRLNPKVEHDEWVRYWAALALARLQPPDFMKQMEAALKDRSDFVRAVALRLLIENGREDYMEQLQTMMRDDSWVTRMAACKVLRRDAGQKSLRERVEKKFLPTLVERLQDRFEVTDVRFQAARALGSMEHQWLEAIKALNRSLEENLPDWIRRTCIDALAQINKPETRHALLFALNDQDAEIRVRAAQALKKTLGAAEAVNFIVDSLLQNDATPTAYLDALRYIDHTAAATALAIPHPDPKIADRASRALTLLGGEAALRSLQAQRTEAVEKYTELLGNADKQIMALFKNLLEHAQIAFTMTMWMHGTIFVLGVATLVISLYMATLGGAAGLERAIGMTGATGSLATLLLLFYRNPLKNVGQSVNNLIKVNVLFLGYMRQINQIDATFKHLFLASSGFDIPQMQTTVAEIEGAVQNTLVKVKEYLQ